MKARVVVHVYFNSEERVRSFTRVVDMDISFVPTFLKLRLKGGLFRFTVKECSWEEGMSAAVVINTEQETIKSGSKWESCFTESSNWKEIVKTQETL